MQVIWKLMNTVEPEYSLEAATWETHGSELYRIRWLVFVEEQGVPEELEQDEFDAACWHVLARDSAGQPIATGRLRQDGRLGRLAVLKPWRGRGVGKALVMWLLALARQKELDTVQLHAQTQASDFYEGLGFRVAGAPFIEAGIPHCKMLLRLNDSATLSNNT
jgi:predicted GNAT family N-acyltransferase